MVAYSFKAQFRAPILTGTKRQTIRADRKRHARPGEQVQLYTGMRTRGCSLIGTAVCAIVLPVRVGVRDRFVAIGSNFILPDALDGFARDDGFADWLAMAAFWRAEHPDQHWFIGVLIAWRDFAPALPSSAAPAP